LNAIEVSRQVLSANSTSSSPFLVCSRIRLAKPLGRPSGLPDWPGFQGFSPRVRSLTVPTLLALPQRSYSRAAPLVAQTGGLHGVAALAPALSPRTFTAAPARRVAAPARAATSRAR
jgi:hypothetical protein